MTSEGETIKLPITALKSLASNPAQLFFPLTPQSRRSEVTSRQSPVLGPGSKFGFPAIDDWVQTFESMIFGGIDLGREPLMDHYLPMEDQDFRGKNINLLNFKLRYRSWPTTIGDSLLMEKILHQSGGTKM